MIGLMILKRSLVTVRILLRRKKKIRVTRAPDQSLFKKSTDEQERSKLNICKLRIFKNRNS